MNCRLQIKRNVAETIMKDATNNYNNQIITKINPYTIGINFSPKFEKSKFRKEAEAIANRIADEANAKFQSKTYGKVATVNYNKLNVQIDLKPSERLLTAYEQIALKANNKLPNLGQYAMFNSEVGDTASNQVVTKILDTFKERFGINYEIISPEQAQEVLKDTDEGHNGETGFYFNDKVYIVDYGNGLDWDSAIHEYGHPFMRALNKYNPNLFASIVQQISNTPEGEKLLNDIKQARYKENQEAEELAVRALTKLAKKNINPETGSLFDKATNKLLKFLTSMMRDVFGKKTLNLSTLSANTTLEELADIFSLKQGLIETKSVKVKPGVQKLFDSNQELANQVYEALGFNQNNIKAADRIKKAEEDLKTIHKIGIDTEYEDVVKNQDKKRFHFLDTNDFKNTNQKSVNIEHIHVPEQYRNKGYGLSLYIVRGEELLKEGKYLISYDQHSPEAEIIWQRLLQLGLATQSGEYGTYQYIGLQNQITPQQKQQALQVYSQYLDSIFPDSKVKDIVYRGDKSKTINGVTQFLKGERKDLLFLSTNKEVAKNRLYYSDFSEFIYKKDEFGNLTMTTEYEPDDSKGLVRGPKNFIAAVVNIQKPVIKNAENQSYRDYKIDGKSEYETIKDAKEKIKNQENDSLIVENVLEGDVGRLPSTNIGLSKPEQIHILGGKQDIEGFRNYVNNTFNSSQEVEELFDSNPELANIGTPEQYSQYLDTIFPDSKVKDIVYHHSDTKLTEFKKEFPEGYAARHGVSPKAKFFLRQPLKEEFLSKRPYLGQYLVNIINPNVMPVNADRSAKRDSGIKEGIQEALDNNQDGAIFDNIWDNRTWSDVLVVFEPKQIHILGSKQDVEGFKEFIRNQTKPSFNRKVAQQNASTTLDTLQKKVNEKDGLLSVDGFDNIWKRIFNNIKSRYSSAKTDKQLDAERIRSEADMIIQNIQSDIIKKAFPLENTHISDYVQTPETKGMYELLSKQLSPIIEKAKERGSIMKAEVFVGNSISSKGDIVSILEIDSEGNYYIYDLNTKYSNISAKNQYRNLSEWTTQVNQVKTILETGDNVLGLKAGKVEGVYLLELEIDYKNKGIDIKSKATYSGQNGMSINKFLKNREIKAMNIVAPKFLRTKSEKINDFIDRLYLQIDALMQKTPNTEVAKAANNALIESKLKLAQELQIEANTKNLIDHIQTELEEIANIVAEANDAGLPDSSDLLAQLDVYSKMSNFIDNPTLEQRKEMLYVQGLAVQLRNDILEYERKLILDAATETGITNFVSDVFAAVKDIGWFKKMTMGISKIDNPLVATAFRLYTAAMGKARSSIQTLADKILKASKEYKKFTGTDDYSLIIEGNSLVGEYTPYFWKAFSRAVDSNDWEWLSENVTYNKERYLAKREDMLNFLESQRPKNINKLKIANPSISEQELTKELVELEKAEMRKWDANNKDNLSKHFTPKSKHINPKWREIKEGKYKGTPVEAFYDLYRSVLEGANELFPEHIKSNFIPSFNREFIEKTASLGLSGAIKSSWSGALDNLSTTYDENLYGEIDSATGMPIDKLFIPGLNYKADKSMDLGVVLFKFMEGVYRYKELSEVEQTILAVQRQLRNGKTKVVDSLGRELPEGKVADKNVTNNRTADAFDDWVKSSIYNQKRVDEGSFEITDKSAGGFLKLLGLIKEGDTKKISYARLADKIIRYTSLHNLAFNMYSPLVNLFGGASNMYMSGSGGLDYSNEDLTKAFGYVMQGKTGLSSDDAEKAKLIYEYFAIEQSDINREIANELSNRYLTQLTDKYNGMTLMRESENVMQRAGLIAMILSNKHSMKWDDFSVVDGKLVVEENNMSKELFRQKVIAVNAKNLGGVNPDDLTSAKRYIAGRMIMQHRNWLPSLFYERFGRKQFDYVLERDVEGRYRTAMRYSQALFNKSLLETLTPMEQANLKAARMEAQLLLGTALLVIALKGVDDDEKKKSWYKISNKISTRALGELGFFIDPTFQSQYQILLSPAASTGVFEDVGGLGKSIWKEAFGDEEEKKRAKPLKKSIKLFPLANKAYSFLEDLNVIED